MKNPLKFYLNRWCARTVGVSDEEMKRLRRRQAVVVPRTETEKIATLIKMLHPVQIDGKSLIRIGPDGDGGYLVADDLQGIEACFSAGVGPVSGFEKACAQRGMDVFLADNSVDQPAESDEKFHFTKKHVGVLTTDKEMPLDAWVRASLPESRSDLLLQMDIEGAEYEVVLGMSDELLSRYRIIVIEFHSLEQLWSRTFFQMAARAFEKLLQTHACVHVHPNNSGGSVRKEGLEIPGVAEFTFLRKDRIVNASPACEFPHPLDFDNTTNPSLPLPACWYSAEA